jgi:8-oxo-dGTP pyrophosphatase MutT (NUDIX family)
MPLPLHSRLSKHAVQAAAVPYRLKGRRLEIALITSSRSRHWGIPKGHIEPGEAAHESALREAHEEAGLLGKLDRGPLGYYRYQKDGTSLRVAVFLLRVTRVLPSWAEDDLRRRKWVPLESALELLRSPGLRAMLANLERRLSA